jgi:hypothetical protein
MAIEIRQTKRAIVYRAVVSSGGPGSQTVSKTFRTKAAAQAWERDMLQAMERGTQGEDDRTVGRGTHRCPPGR